MTKGDTSDVKLSYSQTVSLCYCLERMFPYLRCASLPLFPSSISSSLPLSFLSPHLFPSLSFLALPPALTQQLNIRYFRSSSWGTEGFQNCSHHFTSCASACLLVCSHGVGAARVPVCEPARLLIFPSILQSVCLSVWLSICLALCLSICQSACQSVSQSFSKSVSQSVSQFVCLPVSQFVCFFVFLFVSLFVCLYICLSVNPLQVSLSLWLPLPQSTCHSVYQSDLLDSPTSHDDSLKIRHHWHDEHERSTIKKRNKNKRK